MKNSNFFLTIESLKKEPFLLFGLFIAIWFISMVLGAIFNSTFMELSNLPKLLNANKTELAHQLNTIRLLQVSNSFFAYFLPSLAFAFLLYQKKWLRELYLNKLPQIKNIGYTISIVLVSTFFISAVYYYNTVLIPESWIAKDILSLEKELMQMNSIGDLFANLLVFGLLAGLGEELFFRGIFQKLATDWSKNIHVGAVASGLFFTFLHFQYEGFIPRFILGTFFSYFLVYTANLWITILVHIFFNSYQVVLYYFLPKSINSVDKVAFVPISYALLSLLCTAGLWIIFIKNNKNKTYTKITHN